MLAFCIGSITVTKVLQYHNQPQGFVKVQSSAVTFFPKKKELSDGFLTTLVGEEEGPFMIKVFKNVNFSRAQTPRKA